MRNLRNTVQFLNIIQLEDYISTFSFSYRVFQDRLDRKNPNKHCYNWQWTLLIKGTSGGSFVVMASYAPVPFSFYLQQEKKKNQKSKNPKPCFTQLHYWVPQEGKCQCHLYNFRLTMLFSNVPFPQGWVFLKFEDLHFHTIFGKSSYLRKLTKDFQNYFQSHSNKGNFMGSI